MYEVICDNLFVSVEFEGTYEECKSFIEKNNTNYNGMLIMDEKYER